MSLSWRKKRLRIGLGPERIMVSGAEAIEVPGADGGWQAALKVLDEFLSSRKNSEISVVLADQFARYVLLPWNETLKTPEQWLALARHRFAGVHGVRAAEWEVKAAETASRGARLACAVDRALVEALASRCISKQTKLVSVQPFLVAAYNKIRNTVGNGSCWVVVEEPGRLTLVLIERGAWLAIRSRRCDERWRAVLPEILERESAFLGHAEPCTQVVVCAQNGFDTELHDAWRARALSYRDLALAAD